MASRILKLIGAAAVLVVAFLITADWVASRRLTEVARQHANAVRLWRIGKALRDYCAAHGGPPSNSGPGKDVRPVLSWRVHLLPFLGQGQLYKQFRLDEPWDGNSNRLLIPQLPDIYKSEPYNNCSGDMVDCGRTCYLAFGGDDQPFSRFNLLKPQSGRLAEGDRIILVEVNGAYGAPWSKPEDVDTSKDLAGVLIGRHGKVLALLANGCVVLIDPSDIKDGKAGNSAIVVREVIDNP